MLTRIFRSGFVLALLMFAPLVQSQSPPPQPKIQKAPATAPGASAPVEHDGWGRPITASTKSEKSAPAPRHDISGTWEPANGPLDGGGFSGAKAWPEDGKPEHQLPFTPLGLETYRPTKPTIGPRMVVPAETNDPEASCDPQGFPREDLFQLRTTQIAQTPVSVVIFYEYDRIWRGGWSVRAGQPQKTEAERVGRRRGQV